MPDPSTQTCLGGRVVFLIDESEALGDCIAGGTKTKAESIATSLNSLLNQIAPVPDLEVAIAGYRGDARGAGLPAGAAGAARLLAAASSPHPNWKTRRWRSKRASAACRRSLPAAERRPSNFPSGTCRDWE